MKVHIIQLNDSCEYAFIGGHDKAMSKMLELREEYYEKHRRNFNDSYTEYLGRCIWHISTVDSNLPRKKQLGEK